jgi:hypothetical protein
MRKFNFTAHSKKNEERKVTIRYHIAEKMKLFRVESYMRDCKNSTEVE